MTISEFAPDTNCRRNGSGIISDFDSTAPPGIGSRDHSRRLDSSPVEQAKKWLIPIHRRANLTGTTSGVQSLGAARLRVCATTLAAKVFLRSSQTYALPICASFPGGTPYKRKERSQRFLS